MDNKNKLIQRWNKQGTNHDFISTMLDPDVREGKMYKDFPESVHDVQAGIPNMFDSRPETIFAGEKSGRNVEDPMKQYRRIPFHFKVRPFY